MASRLKNIKNQKAKLSSVSMTSGNESGKIETRVNVEEIENGYLIVRTREGRDKKGEWKYETKKWFSKENPLEINTENKTLADLFD